jgi:ATP-binding cassette, subfamily F, member 3
MSTRCGDIFKTYHTGNYEEFIINTTDKRKRDERRQEALDKKKAHIQKSIEEGYRHAKKTGDDKKLGMVASRQKKLDERWGKALHPLNSNSVYT